MAFFRKKRDEVDLGDITSTIPQHRKEHNPETFEPQKSEPAPLPDFFSSVPETPPPPAPDPLFPKKEELPPPVQPQTQPLGLSRVDVELILSKLENIDHRLRWIEDQLRRRGTI